MGKSKFNQSNMPKIEDVQIKTAFEESIDSAIKVFAKENRIGEEEATKLFETKLKNVPIRFEDLNFKSGRTDMALDLDNPQQEVKKTISLNNYLSEDKDKLKSNLAHEVFHLVVSDDKMQSRNRNYVYNKGCHETVFEDKKVISSKGDAMHEALVARMEKKFCQREKIKFEENGLFASGYIKNIDLLEKIEKAVGIKIKPESKLSDLSMVMGKSVEQIAELMDKGEYAACKDKILELKDEKIQQKYGDRALTFVQSVRKIGDNIKKIIPRKNKVLALNETNNSEQLKPSSDSRTAAQKFADEISRNGKLREIKPIIPQKSSQIINDQNRVKTDDGEINFE